MSELPAVIESGAVQTATVAEVQNMELSAATPQEMKNVQANLIQWCTGKITKLKVEAAELEAAFNHAKKSKWNWKTLYNHWRRHCRLIEYYTKMMAAFQDGYVLVPNFPMDLFAVRINRSYPKSVVTFSRYENFRQAPDVLPQEKGEYQNPLPTIRTDPENKVTNKQTGQVENKPTYWADEFQEIDFPINMAKPHIMEATSYAMGLKIFDAIGVLPNPRRQADPVICGQIIGPGPTWSRKSVTFLIGWHVDTRTL